MEDTVKGTETGKANHKISFMAGSGTGKRRELKEESGQQTSPVDPVKIKLSLTPF